MSLFKKVDGDTPAAECFTRDDIVGFHSELDSYMVQFKADRQQLETIANDINGAHSLFREKVSQQDKRVDALTIAIASIQEQLEKLKNGSGEVE